jgi:integrase
MRGFRSQSATFKRLTDAKHWAQDTESAMRDGRYFKHTEAKRHLLSEVIDKYIAEVLSLKPRNARNTRRNLLWWKSQIGFHTLADITPALIAQHRDSLLNTLTYKGTKRSPSTVIRYLSALSHAFTIAVNEWGWMDDNPLRKVTKPKSPQGRVRFLDDDERRRLLDVCKASKSKHLYTVVVLAISTGMRQGEIMTLRWSQVDLQRGRITLHLTKNGERRSVALTGHALGQLEQWAKVRRIDTDFVFPGVGTKKPVDTRKPWLTAIHKAKIENFRFHDLRHCTASYLAMNGASLAEIAEVLGHKTLSMVKRYSHIAESHTHQVVSAMNDKIFSGESGNA